MERHADAEKAYARHRKCRGLRTVLYIEADKQRSKDEKYDGNDGDQHEPVGQGSLDQFFDGRLVLFPDHDSGDHQCRHAYADGNRPEHVVHIGLNGKCRDRHASRDSEKQSVQEERAHHVAHTADRCRKSDRNDVGKILRLQRIKTETVHRILSEEMDHENDQACVITDRRGDRHSQHPAVKHEDVQEIGADVHDRHDNDREQRFRFVAVKLHDRLQASRKRHGGDPERKALHIHVGIRKQIAVAS